MHAKVTLRSLESVRAWHAENPGSTLRAGGRIPDRRMTLGSFTWVRGAVTLIIHGEWMDLYVESTVAHSPECPASEFYTGRAPLRLMPMVDHWRDSDGQLMDKWVTGCDSEIRLEFNFNGVKFDPNSIGQNAHGAAEDYNFFWWHPIKEPVIDLVL